MKLHRQLLVALIAGFALGAVAHGFADSGLIQALGTHVLRPIGQIFLRTIFMIVVPMVFSALVVGVYELGRAHGLGRAAGKTLGYTVLLSSTSVVLGMAFVNLFRPGAGVQLEGTGAASESVRNLEANAAAAKPLSDVIIELIPRNPLESAVRALDGEMLPLMVFALVFGVALSVAPRTDGERNLVVRVLDQIFDACMRVVGFAMRFAPLAVFAIVFNTALTFGTGVFASLLLYVLTVVAGLLVQQFVVYGTLLKVVARRSPVEFFRKCREVYLYAFSTASLIRGIFGSTTHPRESLQVSCE